MTGTSLFCDMDRTITLSISAAIAWAFLLLLTPHQTQAQFGVGDKVASLGVGIGGNYGTYTSQSPALGLGYEQGVMNLGPGVLGLGGYLGYKTVAYKWHYANNYQYDWRYTYLIIGFRGSWHYNEWHGNDRLDTYGGLMLSYNIVNWKDHTVYPSGTVAVNSGSASSGLGFTGYIGTRYYFSDNFGAQAELGYGAAILSLGIAYKF